MGSTLALMNSDIEMTDICASVTVGIKNHGKDSGYTLFPTSRQLESGAVTGAITVSVLHESRQLAFMYAVGKLEPNILLELLAFAEKLCVDQYIPMMLTYCKQTD